MGRRGEFKTIVLGVKGNGHDTGAAIIKQSEGDVVVFAISEARLNRVKHSCRFPFLSIQYCLEAAGLESLAQVDFVVFDRHGGQSLQDRPPRPDLRPPSEKTDFFPMLQHALVRGTARKCRHAFISHLDAHAASAYLATDWDNASILVLDGGFGIFSGRGTKFTAIDKNGYSDNLVDGKPDQRGNFKSTGCLYEHVTMRMGFTGYDSGKTMALAAYAKDPKAGDELLSLPTDRMSSTLFHYRETMDALDGAIPKFDASADPAGAEGLLNGNWVNLAKRAQSVLEEDVLFLAREAKRKSGGSRNLAYAGGVALSCVANRKLINSGEFDKLFVQPAASDEGIPLGCALGAYHMQDDRPRWRMNHAYLGRPNDPSTLTGLLDRCGLRHRPVTASEVAGHLADGCVVARVAGASEYGPRALGNRSILADPRRSDMVAKLNRRVKHREGFRPFAPAVHLDKVYRYFDLNEEMPYMVVAAWVKPEMRSALPAITHVDHSSRPQTVTREQNPEFYDLIDAFGEKTGIFCLVNTSFNDNGEPIVETYVDALLSFSKMEIEYLLLENILVEKPTGTDWVQPLLDERRRDSRRRYEKLAERYCDETVLNTILDDAGTLTDGEAAMSHFTNWGFGPFR